MEASGASGARPPVYWLISKRGHGRTEVLTVDVGGEDALPVFSFEEEARLFWLYEGLGMDWRVEKTTAGGTRRALFGPLSGVNRVVLDPLPASFGKATNLLVSLRREEFAGRLYAWGGAGSPKRPRRRCLHDPHSTRRAGGGRKR